MNSAIAGLGGHARRVTALVLARFASGRDTRAMDRWLAGLPASRQLGIISSVLGLLFVLSLLAASFGALGLAIYFVVIAILFRPR